MGPTFQGWGTLRSPGPLNHVVDVEANMGAPSGGSIPIHVAVTFSRAVDPSTVGGALAFYALAGPPGGGTDTLASAPAGTELRSTWVPGANTLHVETTLPAGLRYVLHIGGARLLDLAGEGLDGSVGCGLPYGFDCSILGAVTGPLMRFDEDGAALPCDFVSKAFDLCPSPSGADCPSNPYPSLGDNPRPYLARLEVSNPGACLFCDVPLTASDGRYDPTYLVPVTAALRLDFADRARPPGAAVSAASLEGNLELSTNARSLPLQVSPDGLAWYPNFDYFPSEIDRVYVRGALGFSTLYALKLNGGAPTRPITDAYGSPFYDGAFDGDPAETLPFATTFEIWATGPIPYAIQPNPARLCRQSEGTAAVTVVQESFILPHAFPLGSTTSDRIDASTLKVELLEGYVAGAFPGDPPEVPGRPVPAQARVFVDMTGDPVAGPALTSVVELRYDAAQASPNVLWVTHTLTDLSHAAHPDGNGDHIFEKDARDDLVIPLDRIHAGCPP